MPDYKRLVAKALAAAGLGGAAATASPDEAEATFFGKRALMPAAVGKTFGKAEEFAKQGMPPEEIWKRTGMRQGADLLGWRGEIPDKPARFDPGRDYLKAPRKDIPPDPTGTFSFGPEFPIPKKASQFTEAAQTWNNMLERGGRPITDVLEHPKLFSAYPQLEDTKYFRFDPMWSPSRKAFVYTRPSGNAIIGVAADLDPRTARSSLFHELQHRVQNIEGWSPGGGLQVPAVTQDAARQLGLPPTSSYEEINKVGGGERALFNAYQRLMGEVEARNAQVRSGMKSPQTYSPWLSEDYPARRQIFQPPRVFQPDLPFPPTPE